MPKNIIENTDIKKEASRTIIQPEDTMIMQEITTELGNELFKQKEDIIQTYNLLDEVDGFISANYASVVAAMLQGNTEKNCFKQNLTSIEGINLEKLIEDYIANSKECIQNFIANIMREHVASVKEIFLAALAIEKLQEEWKDSESHQHILKVFQILNSALEHEQLVTIVKKDSSEVTVPRTLRISDKEISVGSPTEHVLVSDIKRVQT